MIGKFGKFIYIFKDLPYLDLTIPMNKLISSASVPFCSWDVRDIPSTSGYGNYVVAVFSCDSTGAYWLA